MPVRPLNKGRRNVKKALFWVVGVVLLVFGAVGFDVFAEDVRSVDDKAQVVDIVIASCMLILGVLCFIAARRNYRLGWSTFIGVLLAFLGIAMAGMGFDDLISGNMQGLAVTFVLACVFVVAGGLLIWRA